MERDVTISSLLGGLLDLLQKTATQTAIYVLVVGGLGAFGVIAGLLDGTQEWGLRWGRTFSAGNGVFGGLYGLLILVVTVPAGLLFLKALYGTRRPVSSGLAGVWPYIGLAILSGIGTIVGFILLIVPGIIVMIRWSAANGYLLGSGKQVMEALSASWEATRGHSWAIFFAGLIVLIAMGMLVSVAGGLLALGNDTVGEALGAFTDTLFNAVFMAFAATVYFQVDTEYAGELREVFA